MSYSAYVAHGQLGRAQRLLQASYEQHALLGNQRGQAYALALLGEVAWRQGALAEATGRFNTSLAISQPLEDRWCEALALEGLGRVVTEAGCADDARAYLHAALRVWLALGGHPGRMTQMLESVVVLAVAEDQFAPALQLGSAIAAIQRSLGLAATPFEHAVYAQALDRARGAEGAASEQLWQAGSTPGIDQVVELAQALLAGAA